MDEHKLEEKTICSIHPNHIARYVNEHVIIDRQWNVDLIKSWLLEEYVRKLFTLPLPQPTKGEDGFIWFRAKNGDFSIKQAYLS